VHSEWTEISQLVTRIIRTQPGIFFLKQPTWSALESWRVMQLRRLLCVRRDTSESQIHELAGCIRIQNPDYIRLTECAAYEA
jgi:hypothetical protein